MLHNIFKQCDPFSIWNKFLEKRSKTDDCNCDFLRVIDMSKNLIKKCIISIFFSMFIFPISLGYSNYDFSTNDIETLNIFTYDNEKWSSVAQWKEPGSQYELTAMKIFSTDFLSNIHATWIHNDSKLYLGHWNGFSWTVEPTYIRLDPYSSLDYAFNVDDKGVDHLWWMGENYTTKYMYLNGSNWSENSTLNVPITSIHDSYLSSGDVMYLMDSTTLWIGNGSATPIIVDKGFNWYLKEVTVIGSDLIHLFYTTRSHEDNFNVLSIQSFDGGQTWTNQMMVVNATAESQIPFYHILSTDFTHPIVAQGENSDLFLFHKVDRTWESDTFSKEAIFEHMVFYSYYNGSLWNPQVLLSLPEKLLSIEIEDAIVGPDDNVHLFWIARFEGTHVWELMHDIIVKNGTLLKRNRVMSTQNHFSNIHSIVSDSGVLQVFVMDTLVKINTTYNVISGFEISLGVSSGFVVGIVFNRKRK